MSDIRLGQVVELNDARRRHAVVRFVGTTRFAAGDWIGLELTDASGKNDGSVQGEQYFDCEPLHGMFVRATAIAAILGDLADEEPAEESAEESEPAAEESPVEDLPDLPDLPPPRTVARLPAAAPIGKKPARPSSFNTTSLAGPKSRQASVGDPNLSRRMSLNAPSPSPGPKSRLSLRSPTKSPTKQLGAPQAGPSSSSSRTVTPSNAKSLPGSTAAAKIRPSLGTSRSSMGPPSFPTSKTSRQPSLSLASSRAAVATSRTAGGRLPSTSGTTNKTVVAPSTAAAATAGGLRRFSSDLPPSKPTATTTAMPSSSATPSGVPKSHRVSEEGLLGSPIGDDSDILSPQPTSPVMAKTKALEKMAAAAAAAAATAVAPSPLSSSVSASLSAPKPVPGSRSVSGAALNKEVEDLKSKLKVLERKRLEDREKLKLLDKMQGERDKFEAIIQKLQVKYQPVQQENVELKKLLKDAEQRLGAIESLQAEHDTDIELATLDREMAEEHAENLKLEVEALKTKAEELELELEILRDEHGELTKGMTPEELANTGWIQMEKTNGRLREALIRLRDLSQEQEEDLREQIKSLEQEVKDYGATRADLEAARERLQSSEAVMEDLRQQLDVAEGADGMIEELTEQNGAMAERIEELKAVVDDLEALKEINDDLDMNHVQNERELQEELDLKDGVIAEQARRAVQQEEAVEDMEYTLSRFRELVTSLQGDLEDMRASHAVTETESEKLTDRSRAMMDINMKLQVAAAKTQVKTIDLELRRLEAEEAEEHLGIVKLFVADGYRDDRDSVLTLLRFRRVAFKANLVHSFLKERVGAAPVPAHEDDVLDGRDAMDRLTWVAAMCGRFVGSISHCTLKQFARYQGALYEMEPVERALNGWIDGLRRDELKERRCAEELRGTMALMSHLAEVHMGSSNGGADGGVSGGGDGDKTGAGVFGVDSGAGAGVGVGVRDADGDGDGGDGNENGGSGSGDDLRSFADEAHMRAMVTQSHLESAAAMLSVVRYMVLRVVGGQKAGAAGRGGQNKSKLAGHVIGEEVVVEAGQAQQEEVGGPETTADADGTENVVDGNGNRKEVGNDDDGDDGDDDDNRLGRNFAQTTDAMINQTRSAKVVASKVTRALEELRARSLSLPVETREAFGECEMAARDLCSLARQVGLDLHAVLNEEGRTEPFTYAEVQATVERAVQAVQATQAAQMTTSRSDPDLLATYTSRLRAVTSQVADLAALASDLGQTQEFDPAPAPWKLRWQEVKTLQAAPVDAEEDLRRVREELREAHRALRQGGEELEISNLRIATLESRMRDAKENAARIVSLQADVAAAREKTEMLEGDMARLDRESKALEAERDRWKKMAGDKRAVADDADATGARMGQEQAVAAAREAEALRDDVSALQSAVRFLREDNRRARMTEQHTHDWLAEPLRKAPGLAEQRRAAVATEGREVLTELVRLATSAEPFRLSGLPQDRLAWRPAASGPRWYAARQREHLAAWRGWKGAVARKSETLLALQRHEEEHGGGEIALRGRDGGRARARREVAARLRIRLPDTDGKTVATGPPQGTREVQIVGSREWEALQGRHVTV